MKRSRFAVVAVALSALAVPATAQAHVFLEQTEAPAEGFPILDWVVPHGCDGSPTTSITVRFPKSVPSVTPEVVPGWELTTREGPKDETELFGETVTEGISEVTWTAQEDPLPDPYLMRFGAEIALPDAGGETLYFPAIQRCEEGETRWIQVPAEGETEEDLDEPAPALTLTAAEAGDEESTGEEEATGSDEDEDDAPMSLGVAALILGGLGLLAGGGSLLAARRR
jgi:uncharacterized protein YcnI